MAALWSSDHSAIYRGLHLQLGIANDLSLAIGLSRVDQKVSLMQLPRLSGWGGGTLRAEARRNRVREGKRGAKAAAGGLYRHHCMEENRGVQFCTATWRKGVGATGQ
jgi:hypothetical protein